MVSKSNSLYTVRHAEGRVGVRSNSTSTELLRATTDYRETRVKKYVMPVFRRYSAVSPSRPSLLTNNWEIPYSTEVSIDTQVVGHNYIPDINDPETQIRMAYDSLTPIDALFSIGMIWNDAEKTCELAAARCRLLLRNLPKPQLAELPSWFDECRNEWDQDDNESLSPASLSASKLIVRHIASAYPTAKARVSVGLLGRVVLDWYDSESRYSWMIDPCDLPFPSVRIYEACEDKDGSLQTRIIHDVFCAIDALKGKVCF